MCMYIYIYIYLHISYYIYIYIYTQYPIWGRCKWQKWFITFDGLEKYGPEVLSREDKRARCKRGPCALRSDSCVVMFLTPTCASATVFVRSNFKGPFHTDPFYIPWVLPGSEGGHMGSTLMGPLQTSWILTDWGKEGACALALLGRQK